ncbi:putative peptidoglycan biosynthesis protein MviN, partial [Mycobacterium marinum]
AQQDVRKRRRRPRPGPARPQRPHRVHLCGRQFGAGRQRRQTHQGHRLLTGWRSR